MSPCSSQELSDFRFTIKHQRSLKVWISFNYSKLQQWRKNMHEKIAFKAMSNTRKDSWGLAKKKHISADSGYGQIRKQVIPLYKNSNIMGQICDNKSTIHRRRHRNYLSKFACWDARIWLWTSSSSLMFLLVVEYLPNHPPNLLKFRSPWQFICYPI